MTDRVAWGNARADAIAPCLTRTPAEATALFFSPSLQPQYSPDEWQCLLDKGGKLTPQGWITINNLIALPSTQAQGILKEIHDSLHIGPEALHCFLQPLFFLPALKQSIIAVHKACSICAATNAQGGLHPRQTTHQLRGHLPAEDWQIDFTHMPTHKKFKFILTLVDTFSGWIEALPTTSEMAETVATILLSHIIPRFGLPVSIQTDR